MSSIKDRINTSTNSVKSGKNLIKDVVNSYGGDVTSAMPTFKELADAISLRLIASVDPITLYHSITNAAYSGGFQSTGNIYESEILSFRNKTGIISHYASGVGGNWNDQTSSYDESYGAGIEVTLSSNKTETKRDCYDYDSTSSEYYNFRTVSPVYSTVIIRLGYPGYSSDISLNDMYKVLPSGASTYIGKVSTILGISGDISPNILPYPPITDNYLVFSASLSNSPIKLYNSVTNTTIGSVSTTGFSSVNDAKYMLTGKLLHKTEGKQYYLSTGTSNDKLYVYRYDESTRMITLVSTILPSSHGYSKVVIGTILIHFISSGKHSSKLFNDSTLTFTEVSSSSTSNVYSLLGANSSGRTFSYLSDDTNNVNYVIAGTGGRIYRVS